jgi:hypothetical protein
MTITHELPQPPHRALRRTGKKRGSLPVALFCFPHTIAGLFLLLAAVTRLAVLLFGTDVTGQVVGVEQRPLRSGEVSYLMTWQYEHNGRTFTQRDEISREAAANAAPGSRRLTVRAWGRSAVLTGAWNSPWWDLLKLALFSSVWNAAIFWFQWGALGRRLWDWWLLRHGLAVPATVQKVVSSPLQKSWQAKVYYQFQHPGTTTLTAAHTAFVVPAPPDLEEGTAVVALVHPRYAWMSTLVLATGYGIEPDS